MDKVPEEQQYDYHKYESVYISDYIKFADGKAGLTLGVSGALFAFFATSLKTIWKNGFSCKVLSEWTFYGFFFSLIALGTGIVYLALTIWPRYRIDKTLYHSWGGISGFKTIQMYRVTLSQSFQNREEFLNDMMDQNHSLARVCTTKYTRLRQAYFFLVAGVVLGSITWLLE